MFIRAGRAGTGWGLTVNAFQRQPEAGWLAGLTPSLTPAERLPGQEAWRAFEKHHHPHTFTSVTATSLEWNLTEDPWERLGDFYKGFSWAPPRSRDAN